VDRQLNFVAASALILPQMDKGQGMKAKQNY
jgi:hypothetical protein